jgi:hypothetical protein
MNKIILTILALLLFAIPSFAAELKFAWEYTPEEQANVEGFKLYRDGVTEEAVIPADARTVTIPRQTDKQSHSYHLTAFNAEEESGPSGTAIDVYSTKKLMRVEGVLSLEVIE